ncbi:tripartite tricarboxylate transporter substrate binding protein [Roseococcus sp. SYP-B2431]|uniref:Bug family tripartite tricarboxylate transporter substrate binding protein n=1 Tax=Roseococcus sp. SYP-B2431 TaxID=2496640 RepID=UPI001038EA93|nr:tripartite tricarboxylate transporter substrate binding protein [Roseococcus sp. SYP-B2431]TCI00400.1 tripartite tricarboxylate transporter substrate binding protein [Roseococcus sp. SYP-B2431]
MRHAATLPLARRALLPLAAGLAAMPVALHAQTYPDKAIRMVVPYTPGGGTDNLGRIVARALGEQLGQSVVIENRGGAGGNIGSQNIAQSPADGYSLLFTGNGIAISNVLFRNPGFDWRADFVHVARFASTPMLLVVNPAMPARNLAEFIALARANPGKYNHGTPGAGTSQHLAAALFDDMAGTQIAHVPYRGTAPSVTALVAGEVEVMFASVSAVEPLIRDGKIRALANTAGRRARAWPDLPAIGEALPGYAAELWYTMAAPARTPAPVVARLEEAARKVMEDRAFQSMLMERGFDPEFLGSAALTRALEEDNRRWAPLIPRLGITAD